MSIEKLSKRNPYEGAAALIMLAIGIIGLIWLTFFWP